MPTLPDDIKTAKVVYVTRCEDAKYASSCLQRLTGRKFYGFVPNGECLIPVQISANLHKALSAIPGEKTFVYRHKNQWLNRSMRIKKQEGIRDRAMKYQSVPYAVKLF